MTGPSPRRCAIPTAGNLAHADVRIAHAVSRLQLAVRTGTPCAPVRDLIADDVNLAYAVQRALTEDRIAAGVRVVGRKIGLTAPSVQAQLGVDQPDFGVLFDDMEFPSGSAVDHSRLLQPRIEAEVAFVLRTDIADPDATAASVRHAVDYATPALEIVDSRIAQWDISFTDTVADNASSGLYVLGTQRRTLAEFEPVSASMVMTVDGEQRSAGSGDACLGDPLNALAWLARTAVAFGEPLRGGQVVLSGALGPMVPVRAGALVHATISGLGSVEARFTDEARSQA